MLPQNDPNVVWAPIPGSSQEWALDSRCDVTLYCGARGPGKTDTQLMKFRRYVGIGYGKYWRGIIFDREYKNLDDLVNKSKRWFNSFDDGAKFQESKADYRWVWPTGEELLFRTMKTIDDYENYHGQEFPFIGWNELTKYPTLDCFDVMFSCNRSSFRPEFHAPVIDGKRVQLPEIPLIVFATTNPYGAGHNAVKKRFIDPAPYGHIVRKSVNVFNPRTQKREDYVKTQVAIFGSYRENIFLDPQYVANLEGQTDKNRRKAWLEGSWDISSGGVFDDIWDSEVHIIPRLKVPSSWYIDRALDWGSSTPFSYGVFACSNGEEATFIESGKKFCPPAGTIIQVGEIYGADEIGTNRGVRKPATQVAQDIKAYENYLVEIGVLPRLPSPGPADNSIREVRELQSKSIENLMAEEKVYWHESDKSKGSRINGVELFRQRLQNAVSKEGEAYYVTRDCQATIEIVPSLPRSDKFIDDVDTDAEDHPWDMTRFRILKGSQRYATSIPIDWPD